MFFSALLPSLIIQLPIVNQFLSDGIILRLVMIFFVSSISGFFVFYCLLDNKKNGIAFTLKEGDLQVPIAHDSIQSSAIVLAKHSATWLCLYCGVIEYFIMIITLCISMFNPSIETAYYVTIPLTNIMINLLDILTIGIAVYFLQRRILSQPIQNKYKLIFNE